MSDHKISDVMALGLQLDELIAFDELHSAVDTLWFRYLRGYAGSEAEGIADSMLEKLYPLPTLWNMDGLAQVWRNILGHSLMAGKVDDFFEQAAKLQAKVEFNIVDGYWVKLAAPSAKDPDYRERHAVTKRLSELLGMMRYIHQRTSGSTHRGRQGMMACLRYEPTGNLIALLGGLVHDYDRLLGNATARNTGDIYD